MWTTGSRVGRDVGRAIEAVSRGGRRGFRLAIEADSPVGRGSPVGGLQPRQVGGPEGPPYRSSPPYTSTLSIQARSRLSAILLFATSQSYLPQRVGGSQRSTHELSVGLAARGNESPCCATRSPARLDQLQNRPLPGDGPQLSLRSLAALPHLSRLRRERGAREVARAFRPDVAIVHAGLADAAGPSFLAHEIRTVLYFRDVQFGAIGGSFPGTSRLRFLANSEFTASRAARASLGSRRPSFSRWSAATTYRTPTIGRHVLFVNPVAKKDVERPSRSLAATRTSRSSFSSRGRWRRDRSDGLRDRCFRD